MSLSLSAGVSVSVFASSVSFRLFFPFLLSLSDVAVVLRGGVAKARPLEECVDVAVDVDDVDDVDDECGFDRRGYFDIGVCDGV